MPRKQHFDPRQETLFGISRKPIKPAKPIPLDFTNELSKAFQNAGFGLDPEIWLGHGSEVTLTHPLFKLRLVHDQDFIEYRKYLMMAVEKSLTGNTLIFLPTSLGKTYLALIVMGYELHYELQRNSMAKILFVAPTVYLVNQQYQLARNIFIDQIVINQLTGEVNAKKRPKLWQEASIIFATAETILSEINKGTISLGEIKLLVVDEAHLVTGENSAYQKLVSKFPPVDRRILYLTPAPPSDNFAAVEAFRARIGVKREQVFARSFTSTDVQPWLYFRTLQKVVVPNTTENIINIIREELSAFITENYCRFKEFTEDLAIMKIFDEVFLWHAGKLTSVRIGKLSELGKDLDRLISQYPNNSKLYSLKFYWAVMLKAAQALDRLNTKGLIELQRYLARQINASGQANPTSATLFFVANERIKKIQKLLGAYQLGEFSEGTALTPEISTTDPKVKTIFDLIERHQGEKIIIFTSLRDSLWKIKKALAAQAQTLGMPIYVLTGQLDKYDDPGMSREAQRQVCQKFRQEKKGIIIATSVGEAGLNLSVDIAIAYEPVTNVLRHINRLGRVARNREGRVYILTYQGTYEEKLFFVIRQKEINTRKIINYYSNID